MRRVCRTDSNQAAIVAALRAAGATVQHLHQLGQGMPDLLVGYQGQNLLLEIKDGRKPLSARKLTPAEQAWIDRWGGQVAVVSSVQEAIALLHQSPESGSGIFMRRVKVSELKEVPESERFWKRRPKAL